MSAGEGDGVAGGSLARPPPIALRLAKQAVLAAAERAHVLERGLDAGWRPLCWPLMSYDAASYLGWPRTIGTCLLFLLLEKPQADSKADERVASFEVASGVRLLRRGGVWGGRVCWCIGNPYGGVLSGA